LRTLNEAMYKEFSASNCTLYSFDTREAAKLAEKSPDSGAPIQCTENLQTFDLYK
jgi:hypothetical protein